MSLMALMRCRFAGEREHTPQNRAGQRGTRNAGGERQDCFPSGQKTTGEHMKNTEQKNCLVVPKGVEVTAVGLKIRAKLSYQQWEQLGQSLQGIQKNILWWIGDWLVWGEGAFNEKFSQAIEARGYRTQTLLNAQWVASAVDNSRRRESLSWSHHFEVASLPPDEQDQLLQAAIDNSWSTRELREAVRQAKGGKKVLPEPQADDGGFDWRTGEQASKVTHASPLPATDPVEVIANDAIDYLRRKFGGLKRSEIARALNEIVDYFQAAYGNGYDLLARKQPESEKTL
jgi:hypothetical protein